MKSRTVFCAILSFLILVSMTPAAIANTIYVFAMGLDERLWYAKGSEGSWSEWKSLPGNYTGMSSGAPDACSPNPGEIHILSTISSDMISYEKFNTTTVQGKWSMRSPLGHDPSIVCRNGGKVDCFVSNSDGGLLYIPTQTYAIDADPTEEFRKNSAKEDLGGKAQGGPDACAFGGDKLAVFVRGMDGYIWWRYYDGSNWINWENLGGLKMTSEPSAVSRGDGLIDIFARGENDQLWVRSYKDGKWTPWFSWGGILSSGPGATSWGGNRLDVFVRGADGAVWHAWRDDDKPLGIQPQWESVGGKIVNSPTAVGVKW